MFFSKCIHTLALRIIFSHTAFDLLSPGENVKKERPKELMDTITIKDNSGNYITVFVKHITHYELIQNPYNNTKPTISIYLSSGDRIKTTANYDKLHKLFSNVHV
jgi:hypothetical protein